MSRFIFITGGVVSSLGKGIAAASLGAALKARGYKVNIKKLDPYLNFNPGTISPMQHGEVFVTEDGVETDLDLGHYERFLQQNASTNSNTTSGKLYHNLIATERAGNYLGSTIQVVPHFVDLVRDFIGKEKSKFDFTICEIGGTVGDIEGVGFLEGVRQFARKIGSENALFIHVTLLPYIKVTKELKTKPTQHSVKTLMSFGIEPDIILCRTEVPTDKNIRKKIALFCNVEENNVIEAPDLQSIYEAPVQYAKNGLDSQVLEIFKTENKEKDLSYLCNWQNFVNKLNNAKTEIKIAIIGKYGSSPDPYKSIIEAVHHACVAHDLKLNLSIISSLDIDKDNVERKLKNFKAIILAGGFGVDRIDGKMLAIQYARENKVPFLGICFGMQLAIIEFFRNVLNIKDAHSTEINPNADRNNAVVDVIEKLKNIDGTSSLSYAQSKFDGEMNLGSSKINLKPHTLASELYRCSSIKERHRHRYQIIEIQKEKFTKNGGVLSGTSDTLNLPEIFEIQRLGKYSQTHPFFIGVQYHPEFKSNPFKPHPLFLGLMDAAKNKIIL